MTNVFYDSKKKNDIKNPRTVLLIVLKYNNRYSLFIYIYKYIFIA